MPVRARSEPCSISGSLITKQDDTRSKISNFGRHVVSKVAKDHILQTRNALAAGRRSRSFSHQPNGLREAKVLDFNPVVGGKMSISENSILDGLSPLASDIAAHFCNGGERPSRHSDHLSTAWAKRRSGRMRRMHSLERDTFSGYAPSLVSPRSATLDRRDKFSKTRSLDDGQIRRTKLSASGNLQTEVLAAIYWSEVKMSRVRVCLIQQFFPSGSSSSKQEQCIKCSHLQL